MSFKQIFWRISFAKCRDMCVREFRILVALMAAFLSRVSFNRTCFSTPTSSSSTLCWIPLDVSMNLASLDCANAFPSANEIIFPRYKSPFPEQWPLLILLTHSRNHAGSGQIRFVANQNHGFVFGDGFAPQIIDYLLGHAKRAPGHHRIYNNATMWLVGW